MERTDSLVDDKTIAWYEENAESYCAETIGALVQDALDEFLSRLPAKGRVLDIGCGSGRDSLYFLSHGFSVDAMDASSSMASVASTNSGLKVEVRDALSIRERAKYDGVWAQASLLHLHPEDLKKALFLISEALKPGGILYVSFRKKDSDGREGERWYTNMTRERLDKMLPSSLRLEKNWESRDVRKSMDHIWLSTIIVKEK